MIKCATLSDCGRFRYHLSRTWAPEKGSLCFVMLNPSTADAETDDPTIRKCIGFAERLGYGAIDVVNLYAFRATKPADLKKAGYPVGEKNDSWIQVAALATFKTGGETVCAWGQNASKLSRPADVIKLLRDCEVEPKVLARCADGTPSHPLMLAYTCTLQRY